MTIFADQVLVIYKILGFADLYRRVDLRERDGFYRPASRGASALLFLISISGELSINPVKIERTRGNFSTKAPVVENFC